MQTNFTASLVQVLKYEGGWSDNAADPGGATMKGITIAVFTDYRKRHGVSAPTHDDLRNISDADVHAIYKQNYWDRCSCDDLPYGLDFAVFDYAVNSGPKRAVEDLQHILPNVTIDGVIGKRETLPALQKYTEQHGIVTLLSNYIARRLQFLRGLSTWATFGGGWTNRVASVGNLAAAMAAGTKPSTVSTPMANQTKVDMVMKTAAAAVVAATPTQQRIVPTISQAIITDPGSAAASLIETFRKPLMAAADTAEDYAFSKIPFGSLIESYVGPHLAAQYVSKAVDQAKVLAQATGDQALANPSVIIQMAAHAFGAAETWLEHLGMTDKIVGWIEAAAGSIGIKLGAAPA